MPKLDWLASFPKSGNTWVRSFVSSYLSAAGDTVDLERMHRYTESESRLKYFANLADKPEEALSDEEIDRLRGEVQRDMTRAANGAGPRIVKTHNAYRRPDGHPLIWPEHTRSAIYVVRNPLDVVDSFADHAGQTHDQAIATMAWMGHKTPTGGRMAAQYLGSWSYHVRSWTDAPEVPTLVVRYEDLHADPNHWFARIVAFLDWEVDAEKVRQSVARTSFESLRAAELANGFSERTENTRQFFRRGEAGAWRDCLNADQIARVVDAHGSVMAALGYEVPA